MGEVKTRREEQAERSVVVVSDEVHEMSVAMLMLLELRFVMSHQMEWIRLQERVKGYKNQVKTINRPRHLLQQQYRTKVNDFPNYS